jgi:hypothetical protein
MNQMCIGIQASTTAESTSPAAVKPRARAHPPRAGIAPAIPPSATL